ncbi:alcohol dehydrogenase [Mycobacterium sp. MS1601]|uniref:zinc-binding dehydrogenase n=1 Tax=Mycobacterium sp. MS1601 TaxID=1936029 RepID=UPI0009795139|nr:zinc-binding dehydrogenase [Mycobacterium sp. MS1601]AQA03234.1 alcohol dehydrogenase [Mycobacterium sp. MS1601]
MTKSRAAVLQKFETDVEVAMFDVPEPQPMSAIVDVAYAGICGTDLHLQRGKLPIPVPVVLGHEATGYINTLGEGLTHDVLGQPLAPGDAVSWLNNISCGRCKFCLVEMQPTLCVGSRRIYGINQSADVFPHLSGGWADQIYLQPGTVLVKLPSGVEPRDVIPLGCAGPTAVHGVLDEVTVGVGDTVVVQGSGPVGVAAAIYARLGGAKRIIMLGGPASRLEQAEALGLADHYFDVTDGSDATERADAVRALTPGGLGADVVLECAGVPAAVAQGIDLCRPGAQYSVIGQYTDNGATPINPHYITRKQLRVHGSWGFSARHYIRYVQLLPAVLERFDVRSIATEYALSDVNRAMADVRAGAVMKAVINPGLDR